jgi:hypothetical protein
MTPSQFIDREIARHRDWRGQTMGEVRRIIRQTVPDVTEEWKWMGTPTWSRDGILCICNAFKDMVKVTFINGAQLGMDRLFNAELGGNKWRAIKYFEGDTVNATGLTELLHAAVAFNATKGKRKATPPRRAKAAVKPRRSARPKR